jgi:protein TonB
MSVRLAFLAAGLAVLLGSTPGLAADLSTARALYASASYEEALAELASLQTGANVERIENPDEFDELRALCLLALGRNGDAEQALTQIVLRNPAYMLDIADVSPKLVTMFVDVRRRTQPAAARAKYPQGKTSYDNQRWADAKHEFTSVIAVLNDPDLHDRESLADLRELAEGFLKLSEVEHAAVEVKEGAQPPRFPGAAKSPWIPAARGASSAPAAPARAAPRPARPAVYSNLDRTVTPPVEQRAVMPRWSPPRQGAAVPSEPGLLEVIVNENGTVEQTAVLKPTTPLYDKALLDAARGWRYIPATKDGKPVRYRFVLQIVLRSQ